MRFQLWALLLSENVAGMTFSKVAEGATLGALLASFRDALLESRQMRLYLIDTTANTVVRL